MTGIVGTHGACSEPERFLSGGERFTREPPLDEGQRGGEDANPRADFLVLGSGIAGLRAALTLARHGQVLVVTKDQPTESNTGYAQGGVAVAMAVDDATDLHLDDTLKAGAGLVSEAAARVLVEEGPERIRELASWGARFDREAGRLHFTREGAHSRNRVLHALGDATGWEMVRSLLDRTRRTPAIRVLSFSCSIDLVIERRTRDRVPLPRRGRRGHRGARPRHAARHRRRGPGVRGDDQPAGRDRGRRRHGLARGRVAARHGVHAVPPDRPRHRGRAAVPGLGGRARRRRLPAQRGGGAVHRGARRARPGGARHRARGRRPDAAR